MAGFLFRAALSMVGLWIATRWVSGIRIDDPQTLVLAAPRQRMPLSQLIFARTGAGDVTETTT